MKIILSLHWLDNALLGIETGQVIDQEENIYNMISFGLIFIKLSFYEHSNKH